MSRASRPRAGAPGVGSDAELSAAIERQRSGLAAAAGAPEAAIRVVVSPYRVCPIGAHSDHQGGPVLGMAVSAYTLLAFAPASDAQVRIASENFPGEVRFDLRAPEAARLPGWGAYPRAAALVRALAAFLEGERVHLERLAPRA